MLLELKFSGAARNTERLVMLRDLERGGGGGGGRMEVNLGSATTASSFLPEEN